MADQFEKIIDHVEKKYDCIVIYFVTDADGGSKKGRIILGKRRPYMLVPSCWAHQVPYIYVLYSFMISQNLISFCSLS